MSTSSPYLLLIPCLLNLFLTFCNPWNVRNMVVSITSTPKWYSKNGEKSWHPTIKRKDCIHLHKKIHRPLKTCQPLHNIWVLITHVTLQVFGSIVGKSMSFPFDWIHFWGIKTWICYIIVQTNTWLNALKSK